MESVFKVLAIRGIDWMICEKFATQVLQPVFGVISVRLLSPSYTGVVGMLAISLIISLMFVDSGFGIALLAHTITLTISMREYSATWKFGDEPYYPVNNDESAALLQKYQDEAAKIPNLVIGGRLGQYKYFDNG